MDGITIYTVGHSTHPIDEFIALLKAHGVKKLVDVRTIAKSRRNPQFMEESLAASLRAEGLTYRRAKALGGLRHVRKDSPNGGWRNKSFQGYADYMQTTEFAEAVDALVDRAKHSDLVIMCAEAVPWRCHRSMIGDALVVRGVTVLDIMTEKKATAHVLRSFARVEDTNVTYPPVLADVHTTQAPTSGVE
ncbi:DNA repair protein [Arthrobacter livingstonensis]|uniref:DNA repair protein n=1 Tax=Arthrobacter livingstonensis TaxID=670078 RepID=A0A2V5L3W8_9MICC|nr:DUF488 domain-containing protein [Arthrobacter livingstonensis]PYI65232.1 DNA repair protein [Arthrobacter livingstonensis]